MSFIESIKNKIGFWVLDKEVAARKSKRTITSYAEAQHIGILYDAANLEDEKTVHQYANRLKSEGKKVFLLGFVDAKQLPGNKKFTLLSEYFWKEKLHWNNLPDKSKISRFLETEFDLLLNLYTDPVLPLLAASAYSRAHYRVGAALKNGVKYFDAMIDTGAKKQLAFLIEQMNFYLNVIK